MTQSKNSRIKDIRKADKFTLTESDLNLNFVRTNNCQVMMDLPVLHNESFNPVSDETFVNVRRVSEGLFIKSTGGLEIGYLPNTMAEKITMNVFDAKVYLDGEQPRIKFTLSNMYHTI